MAIVCTLIEREWLNGYSREMPSTFIWMQWLKHELTWFLLIAKYSEKAYQRYRHWRQNGHRRQSTHGDSISREHTLNERTAYFYSYLLLLKLDDFEPVAQFNEF